MTAPSLRKAAQEALEALDLSQALLENSMHYKTILAAYEAVRAAIAVPDEPVADKPVPWHHRVLNRHPKSEPEFWPDELRLKYMSDELDEYRSNCAQPVQPAETPIELAKPTFKEVAAGIEVGYDVCGGVDIRLGGEFVYVHINYDYRYTHNAARSVLADNIVELLSTGKVNAPQPHTPVERKTLTDEQIDAKFYELHNQPEKLRNWRIFARAIEAAHNIKGAA